MSNEPQVTHQVEGRVTHKEHFESVTARQEPEELSIEQRVTRLEIAVFPHLRPAIDSDAARIKQLECELAEAKARRDQSE